MVMWTLIFTVVFLVIVVVKAQILLYNTENSQSVDRFDCIYHVHDEQEIPYCRRSGKIEQTYRKNTECQNQGERRLFRDLLEQDIDPRIVLQWSTSVEVADAYANVFYNRSLSEDNDDRFFCNCTKSSTFGKSCEYLFTHNAGSVSKAIKAQFKQKELGDSWNTQRYGKIVCYETLPCNAGALCLDWREICNGVQRCFEGIDEENWDKLEFNECEDDEFRCTNGMCIPEEFWLDGKYHQIYEGGE